MSQPSLFADATVPSPICAYDKPCPRQGRAVIGPRVRVAPDCENQDVACACGRTGVVSHNLAVGR